MVQHGRRAVYEPGAHAWEKPTPSNETEYRRKVRMFEHCWLIVLRGKMLRRLGPLYLRRDRVAPPAALRLGDPARGAARNVARALLPRLVLCRRARRPTWLCSPLLRSVWASPGTTRSSPGRRSWPSSTTCAAVCPRRGRSRRALAFEPRARRRDRRHGARRLEPVPRRRSAGREAAGRRPGALPPDPGRQGRGRLRAAEAAHDDRRRREAGSGLRRRQGRRAHHADRDACSGGSASTSSLSSGTSCAATCR